VAIAVPDGDFASDAARCYIDNARAGRGIFTSPKIATLSGWSVTATPSQRNSGVYTHLPIGAVDSNTGSGSSPWSNNVSQIGNQPASRYNDFAYSPGEQYASSNAVSGPQPGASLRLTSTKINTAAVAGATYTATIACANVSGTKNAANPSADVTLNILANGVVVNSSCLTGLAQGAPWTTLTSGWVVPAAYAGQAIQIQVVATNFLEGPDQWEVPSFAITNATLSVTMPDNGLTAPPGPTAK
jgi:hypothetical protein